MPRKEFRCPVLGDVRVKPFLFLLKRFLRISLKRNSNASCNGCYGYMDDFELSGGQTEVQENLGLTGLVLLNQ